MKYGLILNKDCRVSSIGIYHRGLPDDVTPADTLPDGDYRNFLYIDGEYVYDPLPVPEEPDPKPTHEERISALEKELTAAKILLGVE